VDEAWGRWTVKTTYAKVGEKEKRERTTSANAGAGAEQQKFRC
jgi:hypothetical protein